MTSMLVPVKSPLVSSVRLLVGVCAAAENVSPSPTSAIKPAFFIIVTSLVLEQVKQLNHEAISNAINKDSNQRIAPYLCEA
jgi:hypothetical protein